jgi:3-dehydroquinate synthase
MVDSCIGGKSSINIGGIKNLVGNIYPPKRILIGTDFCNTLSKADLNAGLAEAAKICFCKGNAEFQEFLRLTDLQDDVALKDLIEFVLSTKKWFIEIDEFDKKERQLLNFGHTFGHALEVASNYEVAHGLAVALGMQAAIAFESNNRETSSIENQLFDYLMNLLQQANVTATVSELFDVKKFKESFSNDKKHSSDVFRIILPNSHGGVRIEEMTRTNQVLSDVTEAMTTVLQGDSQ